MPRLWRPWRSPTTWRTSYVETPTISSSFDRPIPEADASTSRRWQIETPTGRLEVLADDCNVGEAGVLHFSDYGPLGEMDGRRIVICVIGPAGWTRLIPPPSAFDDDDDDAAASASARS